jgi:hypothetical protein
MNTINNGIPFVPENTIDPAAGLNLALNTIDALLQVLVVSVGLNTPPGSSANGARFIVGTEPTGPWAGQANKMARGLDGAWQFFEARYALNAADGLFYVRAASTWASAPLPANVQALAGLTGAADRVPYFTGEGAMALAVLTEQARTFLAAVDAAGQRTALGLGSAATRQALGTTGALYGLDSVLGTVSQVAGVPTGAIIERGSNANGQYVRLADGTQICTHIRTTTVTWNQKGAIFSAASNLWTFPAESVGGIFSGFSVSNDSHWVSTANLSGVFVQPIFYSALAGSSDNIEFLQHIGRWY